jgi:hypothetical protein
MDDKSELAWCGEAAFAEHYAPDLVGDVDRGVGVVPASGQRGYGTRGMGGTHQVTLWRWPTNQTVPLWGYKTGGT